MLEEVGCSGTKVKKLEDLIKELLNRIFLARFLWSLPPLNPPGVPLFSAFLPEGIKPFHRIEINRWPIVIPKYHRYSLRS